VAAAPRRPRGRGRLVTIAAVLVVIAAGATAFAVARQHHGGSAAGGRTATTPPGTESATPSADGSGGGGKAGATGGQSAGTGTRPAADLVGTWRATFDSGTTPDVNTRVLTVGADGSVELIGDGPSYSCAWSMRVTAAGPPVALSPSQVTRGEPATSCMPGEATTLTLVDPTHLRRDTPDSGKSPLTYEKTG
jgi:hypothetical protein